MAGTAAAAAVSRFRHCGETVRQAGGGDDPPGTGAKTGAEARRETGHQHGKPELAARDGHWGAVR